MSRRRIGMVFIWILWFWTFVIVFGINWAILFDKRTRELPDLNNPYLLPLGFGVVAILLMCTFFLDRRVERFISRQFTFQRGLIYLLSKGACWFFSCYVAILGLMTYGSYGAWLSIGLGLFAMMLNVVFRPRLARA